MATRISFDTPLCPQLLIERRRPVHICVSLDRRNAEEDVKRLRLLLESLVGVEIDEVKTEAVLSAARALASTLRSPVLAVSRRELKTAAHPSGLPRQAEDPDVHPGR